MRRYSRNILQWNKNKMISMKMTNGGFSFYSGQHPNSGQNIQQIGFGMNIVLQVIIASSDDPNWRNCDSCQWMIAQMRLVFDFFFFFFPHCYLCYQYSNGIWNNGLWEAIFHINLKPMWKNLASKFASI